MRLRARRGFALPMAIFVIAMLTVALTASFLATSSERRVNDGQASQVRSYNAAQRGLEQYLSNRNQAPFNLPAGAPVPTEAEQTLTIDATSSAKIKASLIRPASGVVGQLSYVPALYTIRSTGVYTGNKLAGMPSAERTVGILAQYEPGDLAVLAGWTSLSGLHKSGNAGTLSGVDACGQKPAIAGVAVPTGGFTGNTGAISGTPPISELGTQDQTNTAVRVNWNTIQNENAIPATVDVTAAGAGWPAAAAYNDPNYWPTIHVHGDGVLQSGRGLLIVDGDLTLNGSVTWDGIILVGGHITSNGNNTVYGAVVTGLDEKLGQDVITSDAGNGTKIFQYHSCNIARATATLGILRPLRNTFLDNWKTY